MDNYKDLLMDIFDNTIKNSISVSKEETYNDGFNISKFTIKFNHCNKGITDNTYEKIQILLENIIKDLRE